MKSEQSKFYGSNRDKMDYSEELSGSTSMADSDAKSLLLYS